VRSNGDFVFSTFVLVCILIIVCWVHSSLSKSIEPSINITFNMPDSFYDDVDEGLTREERDAGGY